MSPTPATPPARTAGLTPARLTALVLGCLLLLPAIGLVGLGGTLGAGHAFGRDGSGYFSTDVQTVRSATPAVTAEDLVLPTDLRSPDWLLQALQTDVRLRVTPVEDDRPVFVGIGRATDVGAYLGDVAHDEIVGVQRDLPTYAARAGATGVTPPAGGQWAASTSGTGTQELTWHVSEPGRWTVVVMNADGSAGVAADVQVGVQAGFLLALALLLVVAGLLAVAGATALIVLALHRRAPLQDAAPVWPAAVDDGAWPQHSAASFATRHSVQVTARLDPALSRWQWLVKWFLAIPHFVVLAVLWPVFVVLTGIAGVVVLATGSYPRSLFDVNVGILRWSWRVSYYATSGGIGTDRYPPFTLGAADGYPAWLDVTYPQRLSRGLVLVKWWLLVLPQYLIVGLLVNGWWGWTSVDGGGLRLDPVGGGVLGLLVLVAGIVLLVTGSYPKALFDVIVGFNRWIFRVVAYAALMTDEYPPFRLDQGGTEPEQPPASTPPVPPLQGVPGGPVLATR